MKYVGILILLFLSIQQKAYTQVLIQESDAVKQALSKYTLLNQQKSSVSAWRIQVVTTNDRREMERAITKLDQSYPHLKYHWKHASPYYQLKVGAFEEKADLQNLLITLKQDFSSAIPVKDEIEKTELLN